MLCVAILLLILLGIWHTKRDCAGSSRILRSVNCEIQAGMRFVYALCGDFALNFVGNLAYKAGMRRIVTNITKCKL